jgi:hypothetical protein
MTETEQQEGHGQEEQEQQERLKTQAEVAALCCSHSYMFVEPLAQDQEEPDVYCEKWICIYCFDIKVLHLNLGV